MAKSRSRSLIPNKIAEYDFVCVDCGAVVFDYSGDEHLRDRCYNCMFVTRVSTSPEQEAHLRSLLGCELKKAESNDNPGV